MITPLVSSISSHSTDAMHYSINLYYRNIGNQYATPVIVESNMPTIKANTCMEDMIGLPVWCDRFVNGELCMGIVLIVCVYGVIECKW